MLSIVVPSHVLFRRLCEPIPSETEPHLATSGSAPPPVGGSAWTGPRLAACCAEPDLIAVYESPTGSVGLLLRHTVVPLAEERRLWSDETGQAAAAVISRLRSVDVGGRFVVLQWLPLEEVGRILRHWTPRYEGDPDRRAQIARVVEAHLADRAFFAPLRARQEERNDTPLLPIDTLSAWPGLLQWYRAMLPCWWAVEPPTRRALVFEAHRWIVERVLAPLARGEQAAVGDLAGDGRLVRSLGRTAAGGPVWQYWIHRAVAELGNALAHPGAPPDEIWARRLFLIPYGLPLATPASAGRPRRGEVW